MVLLTTGKRPNRDDTFLILVLICLLVFICNAAKGSVVDDIRAEALRQGVDPKIALSVAKVESGLNPTAIGRKGEIGLYQIMPFNGAKYAPNISVFDIKTNIRIGIYLISRAKYQCSDMGQYYIICYNQGPHRRPKYPHLHPYYKRIVANYDR